MTKLYLNFKRYSAVFAIQLMEMILVIVLFVSSFAAAGLLIYNNIFPFGSVNGILFFSLASAIAVMILATLKYFKFLNILSSVAISKSIWVVLLLNFSLILLLYFNSTTRLIIYYFVVAGAIQFFSLLFIKFISGYPKRKILYNRVSLVIGRDSEKNRFLHSLKKDGNSKVLFVSENAENIKEYVDRADNIYLMTTNKLELKDQVIAYCEQKNKRLFLVPEVHEIAMRNSEMTQIGDIPLFTIEGFQLSEAQAMIKRMMDFIIALIGIVLISPFVAVAAVCIKIEDGGPVFYRQVRSGLNGKAFKVIKLRSMMVDAEKYTGAVLARENDPRVTKVGGIIRAFRIDEFPQFLNVLGGSMSVVGPRPERPVFVQQYENQFPEYTHRLSVKPGITGLAQVRANYTTTAENKLKFDLVYIRRYSPALDFYIILKTIKVIFTREQSTGLVEANENAAPNNNEPMKDISNYDKRISPIRKFNLLKMATMVAACLLIISSSVMLRYNSLVVTMIEATEEIFSTQIVLAAGGDVIYIIDSIEDVPAGPAVEDLAGESHEIKVEKGEMTWLSKMQSSQLLLTKLSVDDMMLVDELARDGLSDNEKIKILDIINENFNEEDFAKLQDLVN